MKPLWIETFAATRLGRCGAFEGSYGQPGSTEPTSLDQILEAAAVQRALETIASPDADVMGRLSRYVSRFLLLKGWGMLAGAPDKLP
jgi:hypothetical protein